MQLYLTYFIVNCSRVEVLIAQSKSNPSGYTSTPNTDDGCQDPGCFQDKISYEAEKEQIEVNSSLYFFEKALVFA